MATPIAWTGAPGRRIALIAQPLGFDPDGDARWRVRVRFSDARGAPTQLLHGGDVEFRSSRGAAQWQTRLRFGAPAAIVTTNVDGPLAVRAQAAVPDVLPPAWASTDTGAWSGSRVVAKALGPHLVQVGWFPAQTAGAVWVARAAGKREPHVLATVEPPSSTFRDGTVQPGGTYRYTVARPGKGSSSFAVHVPPEAPPARLESFAGKGVWLSFSPSPLDPDAYTLLDPVQIVAQAVRAGVRVIQLRTAYGEFWEVTPEARTTIDALVDLATASGIAVVGWTVPRTPSFADISLAVRTAMYRTARGSPLAGLAVDLERGDQYFAGRGAHDALAAYARLIREALGPRYPIVAIVEDPGLEHLTNRDVPYSEIAADSDALLPMMYWRMLSPRAVTEDATRAAIRGSFAVARREAGRSIPIGVGGQTTALGPRGAPPAGEIAASLAESKRLGALCEVFYDWSGTTAAQWDAIGRFRW